jgi:hypothetical protein
MRIILLLLGNAIMWTGIAIQVHGCWRLRKVLKESRRQ